MPNLVEGLLEVCEDVVEDLDKIVQKNTENSKGSRSKYKRHKTNILAGFSNQTESFGD